MGTVTRLEPRERIARETSMPRGPRPGRIAVQVEVEDATIRVRGTFSGAVWCV